MIRIIATFLIKPECVGEALELGRELVTETRKEKGCIQYDLIQALDNPGKVVVVENWESPEALSAHSNSEHYKRLVPAIAGLCSQPPAVDKYKSAI